MFTEPGRGQSIVQENANAVDGSLRKAIAMARAVFWREYLRKDNAAILSEPAGDIPMEVSR